MALTVVAAIMLCCGVSAACGGVYRWVGFTDSNWFRAAYPETVAYGFDSHLVDSHDDVMRRCHGKDARIRVRDLAPQALHAERVACGSPN
jgi:hypothetical protein